MGRRCPRSTRSTHEHLPTLPASGRESPCSDSRSAPTTAGRCSRRRGIRVLRVSDVADAVEALSEQRAQVVIADAELGPALTAAVRARRDLAAAHVVVCAALDSPRELREALDAGADDVMRVPFEPEVLAARVAAGLRAARLRENEALLRSLVANIPGALYRCACDEDWTMQWLSDEIEEISGYPASEFIASAVRTFASVIHADDREQVERSVMDAVRRGPPVHARVPDRAARRRPCAGCSSAVRRRRPATAGAGSTARSSTSPLAARPSRRCASTSIVEAQLAEVRASRARILEAADRARREIERNLHDGAQQRFVSLALKLQIWLAAHRELSDDARGELDGVLAELRGGLAELRDLAHGLHPAVLSDRGLTHALSQPREPRDGARRAAYRARPMTGSRSPSRRPPTSWSARRSRTSPSTRTRRTRGSTSRRGATGSTSRWATTASAAPTSDSGSGLQGLRDRIAAVGGTLVIESRPGAGTVLRARLPLDGP